MVLVYKAGSVSYKVFECAENQEGAEQHEHERNLYQHQQRGDDLSRLVVLLGLTWAIVRHGYEIRRSFRGTKGLIPHDASSNFLYFSI